MHIELVNIKDSAPLIIEGEILESETTDFQHIEIVQTKQYGKILLLDRDAQISERDYWNYQESLIHPAMLLSESPKDILVMGGGDGLFQNDLNQYYGLHVTWVEIDDRVYPLFKKHCAHFMQPLLNTPQMTLQGMCSVVEMHTADCLTFLMEHSKKYDIIFGDLVDPIDDNPFSIEFFSERSIKLFCEHLHKKGILVLQVGNGISRLLPSLIENMKLQFNHVIYYSAETALQVQSFLLGTNQIVDIEAMIHKFQTLGLEHHLKNWTPQQWHQHMEIL